LASRHRSPTIRRRKSIGRGTPASSPPWEVERHEEGVFGGGDADRLFGGRGPDSLDGETQFGSTTLAKNRVGDLLAGGPGDDLFDAQDVTKDRVYCGSGHDTVYADKGETDKPYDRPDFVDDSCEDVTRY
jgi:Ca2+-binding RTX toxin-like protein